MTPLRELKVQIKATTDGKGHWSREKRTIGIVKLVIDNFNVNCKKNLYAELKAYFRKLDWDHQKHGLIYTDRTWLKEFKNQLINIGFSQGAAAVVDYSEQGMQGDNYVSLDVGDTFIREFAFIFCFGNCID